MGPIRDATYTEGQVRLEPGDILVMYTDGLVERRGRDIATGISQAQRLIAGWRSEIALAEGCRQLTETLASPPRQDDVCVIAVRLRLRPSDSTPAAGGVSGSAPKTAATAPQSAGNTR